MRAPRSMKFNDLCTLSRLILNKDFEGAKELVAECMSSCQRTNLPGSESSGMKIKSCSLPHSPMEYLKKNPGEGWRREMKKTRAALKEEKTYIHNPLMKKKSKKVTKAGKEQLSLAKRTVQENIEQLDPGLGDADPTPGFGPLKVSPLSFPLSKQNLYHDCSGKTRCKGHWQHSQPPGRANLESFRL